MRCSMRVRLIPEIGIDNRWIPIRSGDSRSRLKMTIQGFQTFESIHQLQFGFADRFARSGELFGVPDRELDAIYGDASLVRHFELDRRGPRSDVGFDCLHESVHDLAVHDSSFVTEFAAFYKTGVSRWRDQYTASKMRW